MDVVTSTPINILTQGYCRVGYSQREITPDLSKGYALAGHSVTGKIAKSVDEGCRLFTKTLYIDTDTGPVAFCFLDILSGSLPLFQAVQGQVEFPVILTGSHTHYGPGNYFGNRFYHDVHYHFFYSFGQRNRFVPELARSLSEATLVALAKLKNLPPMAILL